MKLLFCLEILKKKVDVTSNEAQKQVYCLQIHVFNTDYSQSLCYEHLPVTHYVLEKEPKVAAQFPISH